MTNRLALKLSVDRMFSARAVACVYWRFITFLGFQLMKLYYYICPRCGRQWTRLLSHSTMKCKFCETTWETKGKKGTRSHFSLFATLYWLLLVAIIVAAIAFFHRPVLNLVTGGDARTTESQTSLETQQKTPLEENLPTENDPSSLEETSSSSDTEEHSAGE